MSEVEFVEFKIFGPGSDLTELISDPDPVGSGSTRRTLVEKKNGTHVERYNSC